MLIVRRYQVFNMGDGSGEHRAGVVAQPVSKIIAHLAFHHLAEPVLNPICRVLDWGYAKTRLPQPPWVEYETTINGKTFDAVRRRYRFVPIEGWSGWLDCLCFDLHHAGSQELGSIAVTPEDYRR